MPTRFPLSVTALIICSLFVARTALAQQVSKVSPGGTKFLLYTPPGYSTSSSAYPLLLFLHGGGEIGDDLSMLTSGTSQQYPSRLIYLKQWPSSLPFIVLTPQLKRDYRYAKPGDQEWPTSLVNEVLEYVRKSYRVDQYRIYLTGISVGGTGCWDYAAAYPTKIAAMIPISPKSKKEKACLIKNIPVWTFHGESDNLWTPQYSIEMVNAINACNGQYRARLNLLYARMHEGWNELYNGTNGYDIYNWFLKFRKNSSANKTPHVSAGFDRKVLLRSSSLHIAGHFFDSDGSISGVKWTQTMGTPLTLSGTTTNLLKLSSLKAGIYEFQLTAKDNVGASALDKVRLEIVSSSSGPAVTDLILMNGKTNTDVVRLTEGIVINKSTRGLTEVNIRAVVNSATLSVRFSVNSDGHTKTANSPGPYVIKKQSSTPEWVIKNGHYVICATPYPQSGGRGIPGIAQCYKITVTSSTTTTTVARMADGSAISRDGDMLVTDQSETVQWFFNGAQLVDATAPLLIANTDGEYFFEYVDNGHEWKVSEAVDVMSSSEASVEQVMLFPNPATDHLTIRFSDDAAPAGTYRILNAQGWEIHRGELPADARIPLPANVSPGTYILLLSGKQNGSYRFVVR